MNSLPMTAARTHSVTFTAAEQHALSVMRDRYQDHRDAWSDDEITRLRFVRWLYQIGRLTP